MPSLSPRSVLLLSVLALASGCRYLELTLDPPSTLQDHSVIVTLLRQGDGELSCKEPFACTGVPNPDGCDTLEVKIDKAAGTACEKCWVDGLVAQERCSDTTIECVLIERLSGKCVACGAGGELVYSTCPADSITCTTESAGNSTQCETCRSSSGDVVSTSCPVSCSDGCVPPTCGANQIAVLEPGACCEVCKTVQDCSDAVCPALAMPDCAPGSELRRDPADCCRYYCEQISCAGVACDSLAECPAGYVVDTAQAPCCAACVKPDDGRTYCRQSSDCGAQGLDNHECTLETQQTCTRPCPTCECVGTCVPVGYTCSGAVSAPVIDCVGRWEPVVDQYGCTTGQQCVCQDLSVSSDGSCPPVDCQLVQCPAIGCADGTTPVLLDGECCPTCIAAASCVSPPASCVGDADCTHITNGRCINGVCASEYPDGYVFQEGGSVTCQVTDCLSGSYVYGDYCCPQCAVDCATNPCTTGVCDTSSCGCSYKWCTDQVCGVCVTY